MAKLKVGDVRIAHVRNEVTGEDEVVVAELDSRGVTVTWPRSISMGDALSLNSDRKVPDPLIVRDGKGWLTLCGGYSLGASASSLNVSEERIRYWRAIHSGNRQRDYSGVNGMTSEIEGLAKWSRLSPVTQQLLMAEERTRLRGVSITAENIDCVLMGGPLNLELTTSYHYQPSPPDGRYTIDTSLLVRTRSDALVAWPEHRHAHQMMQDLMSLVYGKPCLAELVSVMREDDQESKPTDERRFWREAYEPSFGRQSSSAEALDFNVTPLFYFDEADAEKIHSWLSEVDTWGRPTWIGVTALFHDDLPAESRLVQVAVALEALGYAIAKHRSPEEEPPWPFTSKLKVIFESIGILPEAIVGHGGSVDSWVDTFNSAYLGVKHADNPATEPLLAWECAKQGLDLFRCWLAVHLGVDRQLILERLE